MKISECFKLFYGLIRQPSFWIRKNRVHLSAIVAENVSLRHCEIGSNCYVGKNSILNSVVLGNYSCIAPNVMIGGMEHSYWMPSISPKLSKEYVFGQKTTIGHDVWVAAGAIIKQGVKIGDGAIVGANSFVNKDVPPYAIVVGSPAKIIKYRFDDEFIKSIDESKFWQYQPKKAIRILSKLNEQRS